MSRIDQHSAYGFLIYYLIYVLWTGTLLMESYLVFLIVFFSMCPDIDATIWVWRYGKNYGKNNKNEEVFQHHFHSMAHYPLTYFPLVIIFIITLIFDFYPLYFILPVVGIYGGHLFMDTFACGDGIMWGKNPFKKHRYARFINVCCSKTDGYNDVYWEPRYRKTIMSKIGNFAVILSAVIIQILQIVSSIKYYPGTGLYYFYLATIVYFTMLLYFGLRKCPKEWSNEPPNGRYADYRINPKYINGLSEKNRKRHLEKYSELLEKHKVKKSIN